MLVSGRVYVQVSTNSTKIQNDPVRHRRSSAARAKTSQAIRFGIAAWASEVNVSQQYKRQIPTLKLTFSHLKMDGWNTIVSFSHGLFSGAMLVLGSVTLFTPKKYMYISFIMFKQIQKTDNPKHLRQWDIWRHVFTTLDFVVAWSASYPLVHCLFPDVIKFLKDHQG